MRTINALEEALSGLGYQCVVLVKSTEEMMNRAVSEAIMALSCSGNEVPVAAFIFFDGNKQDDWTTEDIASAREQVHKLARVALAMTRPPQVVIDQADAVIEYAGGEWSVLRAPPLPESIHAKFLADGHSYEVMLDVGGRYDGMVHIFDAEMPHDEVNNTECILSGGWWKNNDIVVRREKVGPKGSPDWPFAANTFFEERGLTLVPMAAEAMRRAIETDRKTRS